jgi:hypothetical protein
MSTNPTDTVVSSNSKALDLGPAKAIAGGVTSTAVAFLGGLSIAIADGAVSGQEWINIALATVLGAAAGFGITYVTPTKVTLH